MRVALLSSEVVPFAKTGGLADVAGALPKSLRANGVESLIVSPLYQQTDRALLSGEGEDVWVDWRGRSRPVRVFVSHAAGAPAYMIDAPEHFARSSVSGFRDDHERYAFFGRAALSLLRHLDWRPNIVQGNDWPCGFATVELRARRRCAPLFQATHTLFSVHNLAYQGQFDV